MMDKWLGDRALGFGNRRNGEMEVPSIARGVPERVYLDPLLVGATQAFLAPNRLQAFPHILAFDPSAASRAKNGLDHASARAVKAWVRRWSVAYAGGCALDESCSRNLQGRTRRWELAALPSFPAIL